MNKYYECGMCLIMFQQHHNQTEHCNLCFKGLLSFKDLEDAYSFTLKENK